MKTDVPNASATLQLRRNLLVYLVANPLMIFLGIFGDTSFLLPNLALILKAPAWLVSLPMVAGSSLAFVPQLFIAWRLRPEHSRKKIYAATCVLYAVPLLVPAVALFFNCNARVVTQSLMVGILVSAVAQGLTIIPCWDLFGRMFPEGKVRSRVTGLSGAIAQGAAVLSSGVAAWLISTRSPLQYPYNYAWGLLAFVVGGLGFASLMMLVRETASPPAGRRPGFGAYCRSLRQTLAADPQLRAILLAGLSANTIMSISPLMLTYACRYRGFETNHVSLLVACRPVFAVPLLLLAGFLGAHWGPCRLNAWMALLVAAGVGLAPVLRGPWEVVPQLLADVEPSAYAFTLTAILNHAPPGKSHDYLALYYTGALVPGLVPLVLGRMFDWSPLCVLWILIGLALATAALFLRADRLSARS